jgi:hypothetical protein
LTHLAEEIRYKVGGLIADGVTVLIYSFQPLYCPGLDLAHNRIRCQDYFLERAVRRWYWLTNLNISVNVFFNQANNIGITVVLL